MKTIRTLIIIFVLTVFFAGTVAWAASQAICPVMGGQINKEFYSDYEGKRVYFCCAACIPEFKKDPATYVKKLEDQGIVLEKTPCEEKKQESTAPAGK